MTDTDPPYEVDNIPTPTDGSVYQAPIPNQTVQPKLNIANANKEIDNTNAITHERLGVFSVGLHKSSVI
ncbi:MAG: hypothetical protein R2784_03350 [Saprospiraceae bacterium]